MGSSMGDSPRMAYCYRRNETQMFKLLTNFGKLFTDQCLFDCSIVCEGKVIKGHKFMLAASSDYFKTAFTSFNNNSCSNTALIIREVPYDDLKLIIEYIYQGEIIIPSSQLSSLQKSCQWLKVNCLSSLSLSSSSSSSSSSTTTGLIPISGKKISKVKTSDAIHYAASNKIRVKFDSPDSMMTKKDNLSTSSSTSSPSSSSHEMINCHGNGNLMTSLNRAPTLLYSNLFRSAPQLIKVVDPLILNASSSSTSNTLTTSTSTATTATSTSPLTSNSPSTPRKPISSSSPNERRVHSSSSTGEPFVQLRELLRREPNLSGDEQVNGTEIGNEMLVDQEIEGGGEEGNGDGSVIEIDHDKGGKMDIKEELVVEEEEEEEGGEDDDDEEEEEEEDAHVVDLGEGHEVFEEGEESIIENDEDDKGQVEGQLVDDAGGYLSSEEFEIDIPRSNENGDDDINHHHNSEDNKESLQGDKKAIEIYDNEDEHGGELELEVEEGDEDEDEVIDMRVNSGRGRFGPSHISQLSDSPGATSLHHVNTPYQASNLEAAAAAVSAAVAAAAAAASATGGGSTSVSSNLIDECPSGDSLDLDCGDKLRATANYSMIPFTASIASSFTSATARAIAASTTLAVASGLLSKQNQQQQQHSHLSSSLNGIHSNGSQALPPPLQHHHSLHHHDSLYKSVTNSSNCDTKYDPSDVTVPLKRGRGRPPRHLRETAINGSSSSSSTSMEPLRSTFKIRNILPSGTSSDLLLQSNNNNTNNINNNNNNIANISSSNNHINGTNHVNSNSNSTNHHVGNHLILSASSNLGLTLKRKIRLTNHGLVGIVTGSSPKGRKPKLGSSSADHFANGKNVCPYCPQVYYSNQAMNDHINNVHTGNSRKYTCDLCSKEFSWKISLTKHLRNSHKPDKGGTEMDSRQLTLM